MVRIIVDLAGGVKWTKSVNGILRTGMDKANRCAAMRRVYFGKIPVGRGKTAATGNNVNRLTSDRSR
jgi:hypothetical protein